MDGGWVEVFEWVGEEAGGVRRWDGGVVCESCGARMFPYIIATIFGLLHKIGLWRCGFRNVMGRT